MSLISSSVSDMKLILAEKGKEMFLFLGKSLWIHTHRPIQLNLDNSACHTAVSQSPSVTVAARTTAKALRLMFSRNLSEFSIVLHAHTFDKQSSTGKN